MKKQYLSVLALLLFVSGCGQNASAPALHSEDSVNPEEAEESDDPAAEGSMLEEDNLSATVVFTVGSMTLVPAGKNDIVLNPGTVVRYCDPRISNRLYVYCSKSGCQHNSEECPAWIGNATLFLSYHGNWYYVVNDDDQVFRLIRHDPESNERTELMRVSSEQTGQVLVQRSIESFFVSRNRAYVSVTESTTDFSNNNAQATVTKEVMVDLDTGKSTVLLSADMLKTKYFILAADDNYAYFEKADITHAELSADLVKISLDQGQETVLVSKDKGVQLQSDGYGNVYASQFVYILKDEIHLYDMASDTDSLFYKLPNGHLLFANIYGDWIYFTYEDEEGSSHFCVCRKADGEPRELKNSFRDNVLLFSRYQATAAGFVGMSIDAGPNGSNSGWISRRDADAERFDKVVYPSM